ncbi:hypothetical protein [Streptomyces sp. NPDC051452]|uniref:hypothetical protein n=1 Tax=Streptomyces sp. NPDC051452 TaxID=3365654 RepID=UPI0037BC8465
MPSTAIDRVPVQDPPWSRFPGWEADPAGCQALPAYLRKALTPSNSPVQRCLREPASPSVTNLRRKYGMVFEFTFPARDYFLVYQDGRTVSH